jgi:hypothetical protein
MWEYVHGKPKSHAELQQPSSQAMYVNNTGSKKRGLQNDGGLVSGADVLAAVSEQEGVPEEQPLSGIESVSSSKGAATPTKRGLSATKTADLDSGEELDGIHIDITPAKPTYRQAEVLTSPLVSAAPQRHSHKSDSLAAIKKKPDQDDNKNKSSANASTEMYTSRKMSAPARLLHPSRTESWVDVLR